jgi:hypothetical protein
MEELIKQALLHIDVLGPHVQEGHYDLIGPGGEIILPSAWEEVVEPGWSVTITMRPIDKSPPLTNRLPPGGKISITPLPNRRAGVPTSSRQPEGAVTAGEMPPPLCGHRISVGLQGRPMVLILPPPLLLRRTRKRNVVQPRF